MRSAIVLMICVLLLWGSAMSYASEPAVEHSVSSANYHSGEYALDNFLYWKSQLAVLAEDDLIDASASSYNALYLRLKLLEDRLLVRRRSTKSENWEELRELSTGLADEHPLKWYLDYYEGLQHFAQQRYKEAGTMLQKAYQLSRQTGHLKYQTSSLLALYELHLCANQPFEAVHFFRLYYELHVSQITSDFEQQKQLSNAARLESSNANAIWLKWVVWLMVLSLSGAFLWLRVARYKLVLVSDKDYQSRKRIPLAFMPRDGAANTFRNAERRSDEALTDEEILVDERKVELLAELRGKKILTEEDWVVFRQLFEMVHPDFLVHLRFRHKQITPSEEKLACLIRLHFSTKEIAGLLAVSTHAVNVGRYRLKKRFGLEGAITLEEYLMGF